MNKLNLFIYLITICITYKDSSEYTPINTINDNLQPKSKQSEKYFDNYQVIVDKASRLVIKLTLTL